MGTFVLSPGPYGTFDQGGDLYQWNEANISNTYRGVRGGSFGVKAEALVSSFGDYDNPTDQNDNIGFRVASSVAVPEPGSLTLALSCVVLWIWRRRRNA